MKFCASCNESFPDSETFCPNDGEVLQESPESIVGKVIDGKYKVEGFIAQGGMGAVYRARHILLGDEVVIKTLRSEMRNNAEWLKRFQREGKAARAFRHPNSVTVYDLSAGSDGQVYMVMEFVEGHTLDRELKRRGSFTPAEALYVLEPVADVLDAAHKRGVIHRDLKPENIMLGRDDHDATVVKVLDLGIAKMVGADVHAGGATSLTVAGQILGTPYYMSPEQWGEMPRDGNPEVDGRTDIYSLGVIFFELIAGRKPLGGRTLSELRQKHVAAPLPTLHEAAPQVPAAFSRAVASAMAKDRSDRPQTAGEFVEELRAALGMPPRAARRGSQETDAGRSPFQTDANAPERNTAATLLTSEMEAEADTGRGTSAPQGRQETGIETVVSNPLETQADGAAGGAARAPQQAARQQPQQTQPPKHQRAGDAASQQPQGAVGAPASYETKPIMPATRAAVSETRAAAPDASAGVPATKADVPERRRSVAPLIAAGVVALLAVAGVVGWLAFRNRPDPPPAPARPSASEPSSPARPAAAPKVEAASYWLEAYDKPEDTAGRRVAAPAPTLATGQYFRFHFAPKERGYLYIIGPGRGDAQTMLLTGRGAGELKSNLVGAGEDFVFPYGGIRFILDEKPGTDDFTFIFSPTPLASPAFLNGEYKKELTPEEVGELERFRAGFRSDGQEISARGDGGEARVSVSAPEGATSGGKPLIFDVRVNFK